MMDILWSCYYWIENFKIHLRRTISYKTLLIFMCPIHDKKTLYSGILRKKDFFKVHPYFLMSQSW